MSLTVFPHCLATARLTLPYVPVPSVSSTSYRRLSLCVWWCFFTELWPSARSSGVCVEAAAVTRCCSMATARAEAPLTWEVSLVLNGLKNSFSDIYGNKIIGKMLACCYAERLKHLLPIFMRWDGERLWVGGVECCQSSGDAHQCQQPDSDGWDCWPQSYLVTVNPTKSLSQWLLHPWFALQKERCFYSRLRIFL